MCSTVFQANQKLEAEIANMKAQMADSEELMKRLHKEIEEHRGRNQSVIMNVWVFVLFQTHGLSKDMHNTYTCISQ